MAAETSTVSAARGPGRTDLVRFAAIELSIWSVVYGLYLAVRGVSIASPDEAFANARGVVDLERALGLFHEAGLQSAFGGLDEALSVYYLLGFAPLILGVLIWLGISHRPFYRELRTLLLVSIGVAVVVHVALPVAPPRLLPGLGIADTVGLDHNHDSLFGIPFNPYAAMPRNLMSLEREIHLVETMPLGECTERRFGTGGAATEQDAVGSIHGSRF